MTNIQAAQQPRPATPRVGVIGCGYWGKNLVRNFHGLGALVAIHEQDRDAAARMAAEHDVDTRTRDALIHDAAIEGIVVAAPAAQHYALTKEALSAGKHVFVEKPLALELHQAAELVEMADKAGLVLMVGHLLQYHPAFLKLKELVAKGDLGRLQYLYSNRLNLGKVRREENILWSFAPHDISMILSLVDDEPESVSAVGATYLHRRIADVTTTHLAFPGGQHAHVFVSWLHPFKEQKLVVVGDRSMAVFDDREPWQHKLLLYPHSIDWKDGKPEPNRADAKAVAIAEDEPLKLECQHFLDCIRTGARPRTDGAEGVRVLRVLDAAERSMGTGRPISLELIETSARNDQRVFVHETAIVDHPSEIGAGTKIWHFSHILKGTKIGKRCNFGQNVMVGPDVTIGDNCKVQNNVSIYKGVTLEDDVFCGPSMVFTNVYNPRADVARMDELRETLVEKGCTIGANATIVCGVTLGAYSLIAAGAVVNRDVPPHAMVAGVPAKRIGWVSHAGEPLGKDLVCPRTGRRYRKKGKDTLGEVSGK